MLNFLFRRVLAVMPVLMDANIFYCTVKARTFLSKKKFPSPIFKGKKS